MSKKILFFLDLFTLHFGLANYLQKNTDHELYALVDITDKPKSFFQNQKIINFKKTWYYHDSINSKQKTNSDYLDDAGKKYELNLKQLISNDRFFSHHNTFYDFSHDEIISILSHEMKLFENILQDSKPDFLIMFQPSLRHEFTFYQVCKKSGVIPIIINPSLMGYRIFLSDEINLSKKINLNDNVSIKKSFKELQNYYHEYNVNKQINDYVNDFASSKTELLSAANEFLIKSDNSNEKTHYTYFGRTKSNVFFDSLKRKFRKKTRSKFIIKNLETELPSKPFIYFPLQVEPDRNLLLGAPEFTNQLHSINEIMKSLPDNFQLCVKEHPGQNRDWREISFYKKIIDLPNVTLLQPNIPSSKIYEKSSMVITSAGTSGFEALFYGKPVITFADTLYSIIPSVQKMNSFNELPSLIKKGLEMNITPEYLEKFLFSLEKNSFDFDLFGYYTMQANEFFYGSHLIDVKIPISKMENFLEKNSRLFEIVGTQIQKQIINHN